MLTKEVKYGVIIDTDSYSGSFERQMCAWITGQYGECGMGEDIAEKALPSIGEENLAFFADTILHEDGNGETKCARPVRIEITPKKYKPKTLYQSIGMYFAEELPESIRNVIRKRATEYATDPKACGELHMKKFKILDVRFLKRTTTVVDEEC